MANRPSRPDDKPPPRRALITGAASPIGTALVTRFVDDGYHVVATDHPERSAELANLAELASGDAGSVHSSTCDLGDSTAVATWANALATEACIDVVVHNAALTYPGPAATMALTDVAGWQASYAVNVIAPTLITAAMVRRLRNESRGGAVVFITSLHTERIRGIGAYATTKAAQSALLRELADALAPVGIRVNGVRPGAIATTDVHQHGPAVVPAGRVGAPGDVAAAAAFLADDAAAGYVAGTELVVDGGLSLYTWLHHLDRVGR